MLPWLELYLICITPAWPGMAFVFVYFFYDFSFLALSACKLGQWEVTLQSIMVVVACTPRRHVS